MARIAYSGIDLLHWIQTIISQVDYIQEAREIEEISLNNDLDDFIKRHKEDDI